MGDSVGKMDKSNSNYKESAHFLQDDANENISYAFLSNSTLNDCSVQDLYDATNIKNGLSIDEAADLICKSKDIKIVSDATFMKVCEDFSNHLNLFGLQTFLFNVNDEIDLQENNIIFIVTESIDNIRYKKLLTKYRKDETKLITVLSEKSKNDDLKSDIILHFLNSSSFDKLTCVDAILNCIGIGVLVKLNNI